MQDFNEENSKCLHYLILFVEKLLFAQLCDCTYTLHGRPVEKKVSLRALFFIFGLMHNC